MCFNCHSFVDSFCDFAQHLVNVQQIIHIKCMDQLWKLHTTNETQKGEKWEIRWENIKSFSWKEQFKFLVKLKCGSQGKKAHHQVCNQSRLKLKVFISFPFRDLIIVERVISIGSLFIFWWVLIGLFGYILASYHHHLCCCCAVYISCE